MAEDSIELLRKLVSFDTTISRNTLEAVEFVKNYLNKKGIKTHIVYSKEKNRASVLATIGDENQSGIILSGHLDTVASIKEEWDTDPHILIEKNGKIYGRGTSDMKGGIACALANVEVLKKSGKTFHFALTHDEEGGFTAIKQLANTNFDGFFKQKPKGCIVMEPTMLQPIYAHKGVYLGKIKVVGKESHSAYPELGVDALVFLVKIYNKIKDIFEKKSKNYDEDSAYSPNKTTLDICTLKGGDAVNKIAGTAELTYIMRYLPQDDIKNLNMEIKSFCEELKKEIQEKDKNTDIIFEETLNVESFESDLESEFIKSFDNPTKVSYGTEAGYFQKLGINTIIFGPGSIEQAHIKNEFIDKIQIEAFDRFIQEKLCEI